MSNTASGLVVGTVAYMLPEQARGLPIDARTDIWSIGVILHEMIAGTLPFPGQTASDRLAAILEREPEPLRRMRSEVPAELERAVGRALIKNRDHRYASAGDLAADLLSARSAVGDVVPFRFPLRRLPAVFHFPRRVVATAALLLGLTMIAATLESLERGYRQREPRMAFLWGEPKWKTLRSEPRFQLMLRRVGFPP